MVVAARDRVGGRTVHDPIGDGKIVEVAGQWVGPDQDRVLALIDESRLATFPPTPPVGSCTNITGSCAVGFH
ncbi:FAD-dependent oxidoreductase [Nocardia sp. NPDC049707]|uniref:FAD-dependent oxidoreductase n=1 Tax=Nocardia sp. NPDC049707 TaxID=3154735 RepID=UPI003433D3DD